MEPAAEASVAGKQASQLPLLWLPNSEAPNPRLDISLNSFLTYSKFCLVSKCNTPYA